MTTESVSSRWKGIVLAGGKGTRLYPVTMACSKQLLPVYDKPMIYYPISTLMLGGIRDILVISTPEDKPRFQELLGDGTQLGVRFSYAAQTDPNGIAEAFLIGEEFIGDSCVSLILGDNLFYGRMAFLRDALERDKGGTVFAYQVRDPERYGVVEFDGDGKVISIEEKPKTPKSNYAVPGLYCYDSRVVEVAKGLQSSDRGELEITDLNAVYMQQGELHVEVLGRGMAWLDTGNEESLLEAGNFVATIEHRQGMKIGCLEEIAYRMDYISKEQLVKCGEALSQSAYGKYVLSVAGEPGGEWKY